MAPDASKSANKTSDSTTSPPPVAPQQPPTATSPTELPVSKVLVHPLVLLSVVDHFNRVGKKRVVGVLLGSWRSRGVLDVSNSYAVPFEEDDKDRSVWFLDHDYLENMYNMFKKVNAREKIVGWYHTGPKLQANDVSINDLIRKYCSNAVLVIIDAKPKKLGLPTDAYYAVEEVHDDGTPTTKTFEHVASEMGAEEAEEVGVEHLLRDVKDTTIGTLSQRITNQLMGLKGLHTQIKGIRDYLQQVVDSRLPVNHAIVYQLQDIFNLLPDVANQEFVRAMYVKTNDQMLAVYLASMIRAVIALHNLINNKLHNSEVEGKDGKGLGGAGDKGDKDKKKAVLPSSSDKDKEKEGKGSK